jgi:hypothetical protein
MIRELCTKWNIDQEKIELVNGDINDKLTVVFDEIKKILVETIDHFDGDVNYDYNPPIMVHFDQSTIECAIYHEDLITPKGKIKDKERLVEILEETYKA